MTKSEQARADAMADAETLRLYTPASTAVAEQEGDKAALNMAWSTDTCAIYGRMHAVKAARAAFRAVPGLRGE